MRQDELTASSAHRVAVTGLLEEALPPLEAA